MPVLLVRRQITQEVGLVCMLACLTLLISCWVSSAALSWSVSLFLVTLVHGPFRNVPVPAWVSYEPQLLQRHMCSGMAYLYAKVPSEVNLLRHGVCPSGSVSLYVSSVSSPCVFPRELFSFSACVSSPGVSSPNVSPCTSCWQLPLFLKYV